MFGNAGNNNSNERNVNTRIKTFYGEVSALQLSYWNENISIKINPLTGVNAEGVRQYDYNRRISTALTQEKCTAIAKGIEEKILPMIKDGIAPEKPVSVGVSVGTKGSAVCVEYKKDDKGVPSTYLTMYTNIGTDGKTAPENIFPYKFSKTTLTEDYDPETGANTTKTIEAEFIFVYEKLKNISDAIATAAHSVNVSNAYKTASANKYGGNNTSSGTGSNSGYAAPVTNYSGDEFPF